MLGQCVIENLCWQLDCAFLHSSRIGIYQSCWLVRWVNGYYIWLRKMVDSSARLLCKILRATDVGNFELLQQWTSLEKAAIQMKNYIRPKSLCVHQLTLFLCVKAGKCCFWKSHQFKSTFLYINTPSWHFGVTLSGH